MKVWSSFHYYLLLNVLIKMFNVQDPDRCWKYNSGWNKRIFIFLSLSLSLSVSSQCPPHTLAFDGPFQKRKNKRRKHETPSTHGLLYNTAQFLFGENTHPHTHAQTHIYSRHTKLETRERHTHTQRCKEEREGCVCAFIALDLLTLSRAHKPPLSPSLEHTHTHVRTHTRAHTHPHIHTHFLPDVEKERRNCN